MALQTCHLLPGAKVYCPGWVDQSRGVAPARALNLPEERTLSCSPEKHPQSRLHFLQRQEIPSLLGPQMQPSKAGGSSTRKVQAGAGTIQGPCRAVRSF